jgi:hypothetical protein
MLTPPPMSYAYIFPDAFPFGTMMLASLEIIVGLAFINQSVRKHVGLYLMLAGIGETVFSIALHFIEGFLISLAILAIGFFISVTRRLKPHVQAKQWVRLLSLLAGCAAVVFGALTLRLSVLSIPMVVLGSYFLVLGVAGFFKRKSKQEVTAPKTPHWKRTLFVIAMVILLSGSVMYYYDLGTRPAYVDYSIGRGEPQYYANATNSISISANNWGSRDANFYLILRFENASFSTQTTQPYVQVDSRAVKVPFSLRNSGAPVHSGSKTVFFTVDENVTSFSCYLHMESNGLPHVSGAAPVNSIIFKWNNTMQAFEPAMYGGFVV